MRGRLFDLNPQIQTWFVLEAARGPNYGESVEEIESLQLGLSTRQANHLRCQLCPKNCRLWGTLRLIQCTTVLLIP